MKVTTEKLPKSLIALNIELDNDQVEKSLDRAARRLSQKYTIPGFRKGKAPRSIVERFLGRAAIVEESRDELIDRTFKAVLEQEKITPVGQASVIDIEPAYTVGSPYTMTIHVPVAPTIDIGDYRALRSELELEEITDEVVGRAMDVLRDKHVVLQELEEARPAQQGDRLTVKMQSILEGDEDEDDEEPEIEESGLDLEPGRLVEELYTALIGVNVGDAIEAVATMPDDHANEDVRGKQVTFKVEVLGMQARVLPAWEEVPGLESFEGDLEALRTKTREDLEKSARTVAERNAIDSYIEQLVAQTEYDYPDVMVHELAHQMLHEQAGQYERYGITLEQMLQYRGQSHDDAVGELMPDAEVRTKQTLALQEVVRREGLTITAEDIERKIVTLLAEYPEEQRDQMRSVFMSQALNTIANMALDDKLRVRLLELATGTAPEPVAAPEIAAPETAEPATEDAPESSVSAPHTA